MANTSDKLHDTVEAKLKAWHLSTEAMAKTSNKLHDEVQAKLDAVSSRQSGTGVSGLVFHAINKDGSYLTQNYSGMQALSGRHASTPMNEDSVFYIASCTKMITGIACMQLVEQGKMDLDDHDWLYSVCPELRKKKVLNEKGDGLEDRKGEITLRMLLSHTAGFGYTFFNERLRDWSRPTGYDEFGGDVCSCLRCPLRSLMLTQSQIETYLDMPLVNQPGTRWEYGINIDWAGIAVERVSKLSLDSYFKQHIFSPLGINNISFAPSSSMRSNLVTVSQTLPDGTAEDTDHLCRRAIRHAELGEKDIFHAGGGGGFANPGEYCRILAALLNDGLSPTTQNRILSKHSVDEMFTNQIKNFPDFGRQGIPASKPWLTNPIADVYPQDGNPAQGWGLTFMITMHEGATGRGKNTAHWAGKS